MHRVVKAHLADFQGRYDLTEAEAKAFEAFTSFIVLRSFSADSPQPSDLIYEGDDPGIDSILFFIDDRHIASIEEMNDALKHKKRDCDAIVVFIQSKTSEAWTKSEINTFESAINDLLSDAPVYPQSEYIKNSVALINQLIKNVGKLRGGKPRAICYFATTARASSDREIVAAFASLRTTVSGSGLFSSVDVQPLDRDKLVDLWNAADGPVEATLPVIGMAAFPKAPGLEEGYVVTVKARDFVDLVLSDEQKRLRQRIFEENVRDFMGADEEVNSEIVQTIQDANRQKRFGILNNGITLISPDVRVQSNELFIRDFQIVNGCQTSNILFEQQEHITDDATLMLKVVETDDASLIDEIVRSTNRQTKVQDEQFIATMDCVKGIEKYFIARGDDETHRLYFERRTNQFAKSDVKAIRVFDIREVARAAGSMFFDKPELASRYPNRLTGELRDVVFKKEYLEDIYYTASYALYRFLLLTSNNKIDRKYGKLRWHMLMAIRLYVLGEKVVPLTSSKVRKDCALIDAFMSSLDEDNIEQIKRLCTKVADVDAITRDQIKGLPFVREVRVAALAARKEFAESK